MFARFSEIERAFATPFPRLDQLFNAFDRALFDVGEGFDVLDVPAYPRLSVRENDDSYVLLVDLPGVSGDGVKVGVEDAVLTISAERRLQLSAGYRATRRERANIKFERSFRLPKNTDFDGIVAQLKNGVLTLTLPKVKPPTPRRIPVRTVDGSVVEARAAEPSAPAPASVPAADGGTNGDH